MYAPVFKQKGKKDCHVISSLEEDCVLNVFGLFFQRIFDRLLEYS